MGLAYWISTDSPSTHHYASTTQALRVFRGGACPHTPWCDYEIPQQRSGCRRSAAVQPV